MIERYKVFKQNGQLIITKSKLSFALDWFFMLFWLCNALSAIGTAVGLLPYGIPSERAPMAFVVVDKIFLLLFAFFAWWMGWSMRYKAMISELRFDRSTDSMILNGRRVLPLSSVEQLEILELRGRFAIRLNRMNSILFFNLVLKDGRRRQVDRKIFFHKSLIKVANEVADHLGMKVSRTSLASFWVWR